MDKTEMTQMRTTPTILLVDARGKVRKGFIGWLDATREKDFMKTLEDRTLWSVLRTDPSRQHLGELPAFEANELGNN